MINQKIERAVFESFLFFLLEKWRISSGEHIGEKFSMADTPCLVDIVKDDFPFRVILKSAQIRISEIHVAEAIHDCIKEKGNVLYTFPAGEQMQQFVDARARPAIINNEFLFPFVTGSLNLKKFNLNKNSLYFRGTQKRQQMISVDASKLYADEIAEYEDASIINTLDKRLGASKNPKRRYYSTPKFTGSDIALYYYGSEQQRERGSDQRVYVIWCERCGQPNEDLLWPDNIVDLNEKDIKFSFYQPDVMVVCRFCKKPMNRLSVGEWIARLAGNSDYCHGYHVSKLLAPTANLNQMMLDSKNPVKEQEFWNSDMGLPYEVKGSRLTDAVIDNARGSHLITYKSSEPCFVGVDIGNKIHVLVSTFSDDRIKVINAMELDDWSDLHYVFRDYKVRSCVIDMNPEKDEVIKFQEEHQHVYAAYFKNHLETTSIIYEEDDDNILGVHRTLLMLRVLDMVAEKNIILPLDIKTVRDFYEHLKAPIKALKQNRVGDWVTWFPQTKNPDHYFFALMYSIVASQVRPKPAIFRIVPGLGA